MTRIIIDNTKEIPTGHYETCTEDTATNHYKLYTVRYDNSTGNVTILDNYAVSITEACLPCVNVAL